MVSLSLLVAATQILNPYSTVKPNAVAVVIAGQSNAQGQGSIDQELSPLDLVSVIRRRGFFWTSEEPMSGGGGYGFARSFSRAYMNTHSISELYIIHCAVSGSYMTHWITGVNFPSHLESCIDLIHSAQNAKIKIIGTLWIQGESDAIKGNPMYGQELNQLINTFLDETEAPFIAGELGRFLVQSRFPFRNSIVLQTINNTKSPGRGFVFSDKLTANFDQVHFNHASQDILGERFNLELLRIEGR